MSKELPYFRFTVQDWQNGKISLENYELKGLFVDICGYYWINDCSITLTMLNKRFSNAKAMITELINLNIIKHELRHDKIEIEFLNNQYDLLSEKRKLRQIAGSKGGNAKAMLKQKGSYKDKDKDKDKDNIKSLFDIFWNDFHLITKKTKEDKEPALKHWHKLTVGERIKAKENIKAYYDSLNDKKFCKKARTYLADKNFNDEFNSKSKVSIFKQLYPDE